MSTRPIKLGQLEKLRKELKVLESQAANHLAIVQMKSVPERKDYAKLDVENLSQAAVDLRNTVILLREAKQLAEDLNAELYD